MIKHIAFILAIAVVVGGSWMAVEARQGDFKTCKETQAEIYSFMAKNKQRVETDFYVQNNLAKRLNSLQRGCPKETLEIEKRLRTHYGVQFESYAKNPYTKEAVTTQTAQERAKTVDVELKKYQQQEKAKNVKSKAQRY